MVRAVFWLFLLLALLGCGSRGAPGAVRVELEGVRTSYSNPDSCQADEAALCYDRLDLSVTVVNAGERALEVSAESFLLTAADGQRFAPQAYARPCDAHLRPGLRLACTLVFALEPPAPDAQLFPAQLSFPGAQTVTLP